MKVCCCQASVCADTIGFFPIVYLFTIIISYMFSLYYGAIILRDMYIKEIDEFTDRNESIAITVFVFNEVVVGAVILI